MSVTISELPESSLLSGDEIVPLVQGAVTVQTSVGSLRSLTVVRVTSSLVLGPAHENALIVAENVGNEIEITIPAETIWNPRVGSSFAVYNLDTTGTVRVKSYTTDYQVHALHPLDHANNFGVADSSTLVATKFKSNGWFIDGGFTV